MTTVEPTVTCERCDRAADPGEVDCPCGGLLAVRPAPPTPPTPLDTGRFDRRLGSLAPEDRSGVWRFREAIHPWAAVDRLVTRGEGNTGLLDHPDITAYAGLESPVRIKHEGLNPTASFKDRGMTVGVTEAVRLGRRRVACASTGNTSASMAAYAAAAGLDAVVFVPQGKIALGKMAQALAYGARILEVDGNFDRAMDLVRHASRDLSLYLLNSVNPWRIEGQKAIVFEMLQDLGWTPPDWIVLPAGNLGNTSAFGKALAEARDAGLIRRVPRILAVQAAGAAPFFRLVRDGAPRLVPEPEPETVATAIRIGNPLSWERALRTLRLTDGRAEQATDAEILEAKAVIDRAGIGCEPASAASLAGLRKAVRSGVVGPTERVVAVLTGHLLKDPDTTVAFHQGDSPRANRPVRITGDLDAVRRALDRPPARG